MIKYKARFVTPDSKNKAYLIVSHGGLNHCIEGNPAGRVVEGCVLPNCCGEVHGRCIETIGSDEMLCRGNAENYWAYTKDGLPRSQTPQVGSIMCWRKGKAGVGSDGAGHVAWVEEVNSHGDVLVSESGWTGTKANGINWQCVQNGNRLIYIGGFRRHVCLCDLFHIDIRWKWNGYMHLLQEQWNIGIDRKRRTFRTCTGAVSENQTGGH